MYYIYFGILVGYICICIVGCNPQFYYMIPAPPQPAPATTYYSTSFGNNAPFPLPPQATSFVSRSFGPPQAYYTTHQTFGSLRGAEQGYQTFSEHIPSDIVTPVGSEIQQQAFVQVPTTTMFATGATDQYRGFAYHTQSTNGASANVFFLTGPDAHQIRHSAFTFKAKENVTENETTQKARTLASNIIASNVTDKNDQQQITQTLSGQPAGPPFDAIRSLLENPQFGFQQFYSSNGQLFSRTVQDTNLNFPANTILLQNPILPFENNAINPRFSNEENATKANGTIEKLDDKGEEVAESMIEGVRLEPNATENTTLKVEFPTSTISSSSGEVTSTTEENNDTVTKATKREVIVKEVHSLKPEIDAKNTKKSTEKSTTAKIELSTARSESSSIISDGIIVDTILTSAAKKA